jgi:hypothetical protein
LSASRLLLFQRADKIFYGAGNWLGPVTFPLDYFDVGRSPQMLK